MDDLNNKITKLFREGKNFHEIFNEIFPSNDPIMNHVPWPRIIPDWCRMDKVKHE